MHHRLSVLLLFLFLARVAGQPTREPNPEFGAEGTALAEHLNPETDVFLEPESLPLPSSWQVVTSAWLRTGCTGGKALLTNEGGEISSVLRLPKPGRYRLWVRSHGAANRSFRVRVGDQLSVKAFGNQKMVWRDGGEFDLAGTTATVTIVDVRRNPYADCILLTSDLTLRPHQLSALRSWAGDERWARIGQPVRFAGGESMGRVGSWSWDFGDGETSNRENCAHAYPKPGDYRVTLTVTSPAGKTDTHATTVHVRQPTDRVVASIRLRRAGSPRFGYLNDDDQVDVLVGDPYRHVDAYLHDGTQIWSYDSPESFPTPIQRREHPMVIWDIDGDGTPDVPMWRHLDGKEWLCLCDAMTGKVRQRVSWPLAESYINGRLAVGNLTGRASGATILAFSGQHFTPGKAQQVDGYDASLRHLWSYRRTGGDVLGHFPYSADVVGDAREESFVSAAMIHPDGKLGWERTDLRPDHADSIRLGDLDGDGRKEVVCSYSGEGVQVLDAATGKTVWQFPTNHAQQVEIADVRPDIPGIEVIVGDRFYLPRLRAKLLIFDCRGKLLSAVPEIAITGNPNLGVLQWDGRPGVEIAWANMVLDGRGKVLAVMPGHLHHAFDFAGDGKEEFITLIRDRDGTRLLAALGDATSTIVLPKRHDLATRRKMVNHTHY
jgi:PKD repeat protein